MYAALCDINYITESIDPGGMKGLDGNRVDQLFPSTLAQYMDNVFLLHVSNVNLLFIALLGVIFLCYHYSIHDVHLEEVYSVTHQNKVVFETFRILMTMPLA